MSEKQEIDIRLFRKLFNGEVGVVCHGYEDVVVFQKTGDKLQWLEETGWKVNDKHYEVDKFVGDYGDRVDPEDDDSEAKFTFDPDNFVHCMEEAYRGVGSYWPLYWDEDNKRWLAIDLVSDGCIWTLVEINKG